MDKVLIYRYFGGIPELLKAYAEEGDFWPSLQEFTSEAKQPLAEMTSVERAKMLLLAFGRALRKRPLTQEIMRWELLERNELTDALARYREEQSEKLLEYVKAASDLGRDVDIHAIGSLLAAGQTYLILRAKTVDFYSGLDLKSDADWLRIERALSFLVDAMFSGGAEETTLPAKQRPKAKK